ncbi:serine hydrolase [Candidatus Tachikawaea gelatinosa]|uniref:serine-type D-Ala-D-Ala carboxypeptidase n=1 Tax=Candidatus Tachikawaea gelatinosa TaxID=1410383 RepID=A0A090ALH5_9ENTR|nr:serine hydrolase [Candidatus Tachikawaea gelatinosa]BAP58494.1 D-alanyl-D-alanine carboxypeptidase penicillin-binding protein 5 [Candidatus Tachikawaea gelatinosa]
MNKFNILISFLKNFHKFFLIFCFSCNLAIANTNNINFIQSDLPKLKAKAFILIDYDSNKVLAEKNADVRRDPASLVKIMTSYIIGKSISAGIIHRNDLVKIGKDAWAKENPIFKDSSLMFLKPGDKVTVESLIKGIVLQSGNDACVAIADHIYGTQKEFIKIMNDCALSLGLKNTFFKTVHGLDSKGQYISARDIAHISRSLIKECPLDYSIYKEKYFTFNNIKQNNRNKLLWDKDLNVDGIKTGHTKLSGYDLVTSAKKNSMRLIAVVLGEPDDITRDKESKILLNWGFNSYRTILALKKNVVLTKKPVLYSGNKDVYLGVNENVYLTVPYNKIKDIKMHYNLLIKNEHFLAPLKKKQKIGIIKFSLDSEVIKKQPLIVLEDVLQGNFFNYMIDYIRSIIFLIFKK